MASNSNTQTTSSVGNLLKATYFRLVLRKPRSFSWSTRYFDDSLLHLFFRIIYAIDRAINQSQKESLFPDTRLRTAQGRRKTGNTRAWKNHRGGGVVGHRGNRWRGGGTRPSQEFLFLFRQERGWEKKEGGGWPGFARNSTCVRAFPHWKSKKSFRK